MAVSGAALQTARTLGERAGEDWRASGIPTPNPFDQNKQPALAQAWRRAYLGTAKR